MSRHRVADYLFRQPVPAPPIPDVAAWTRRRRDLVRAFHAPGAQAIVGGFLADRVAWAFAAGYQAALRVLAAERLPADEVAALCVTEERGNRPRDIDTTIAHDTRGGQLRVRGAKSFVTLGDVATQLVVIGRLGDIDGRPRLAAVRVCPTDPGVTLVAGSETPFTPEIRHMRLQLDAELPADRLWPEDAWDHVVKPFGAIEDALVHAAISAWLVGVGREHGWPLPQIDALASAAFALSNWDDADDMRSPAVWRVLEADLARARRCIREAGERLAASEGVAGDRWRRDQGLLSVAKGRRAARVAAAHARAGAAASLSDDTSR